MQWMVVDWPLWIAMPTWDVKLTVTPIVAAASSARGHTYLAYSNSKPTSNNNPSETSRHHTLHIIHHTAYIIHHTPYNIHHTACEQQQSKATKDSSFCEAKGGNRESDSHRKDNGSLDQYVRCDLEEDSLRRTEIALKRAFNTPNHKNANPNDIMPLS